MSTIIAKYLQYTRWEGSGGICIDNLNHTFLWISDSQTNMGVSYPFGSWIEKVVPTLAFPTHWFVIGKMIISWWISNSFGCSCWWIMPSMGLNLRCNRDLNCFTVPTSVASFLTLRRPRPYPRFCHHDSHLLLRIHINSHYYIVVLY